jgi:hypothetical protein
VTITLPTSAKHRMLLDLALRRAPPASSRMAMLERLGRSLDAAGSLTPAMIEACVTTISS